MYASGRGCGLILDVGDGVISTYPCYYSYTIPHAVRRRNFGGREMTEYLMQLLKEKGHSFSTSIDREIVMDIKEKHGYCAMNYDSEIDKWESSVGTKNIDIDQKYKLPDGKEINLNVERFKCAEMLFNPELCGIKSKGVHELLMETLFACDIDVRTDFMCSIILSGGVTMMKGFAERLKNELQTLLSKKSERKIYVVQPPERKYSVWIGGSILASLSTFQGMWIDEDQYDEEGINAIHRQKVQPWS